MLGFEKAKYNNILIMDGDLQHNPKYLPKILELFWSRNLDFLICCRNFFKVIQNSKITLLKYELFSQLL